MSKPPQQLNLGDD